MHQNEEDDSYTMSNSNVTSAIELKKNDIQMSTDEIKLFGKSKSRFPKGYKKVKLIGKGGCAVVYMAQK